MLRTVKIGGVVAVLIVFALAGFKTNSKVASSSLPANSFSYSAEYENEKTPVVSTPTSTISAYSNVLKNIRVENRSEQSANHVFVSVVRVVDGDTVVVSIAGVDEKVRLIGVDTPEIVDPVRSRSPQGDRSTRLVARAASNGVDPRKPVQCFGKESSDFAKGILSEKIIRLESDKTQDNRDRYGRLLRYVFLEDGVNFNEMLIKEGYAYEYTYRAAYQYQKEFKQAQKEAETNKRGLWTDGVCVKN